MALPTKPIEVLNSFDKIISEVEDSEFSQVVDVLDLADFVRMEVKHIQFGQTLKVLNVFNIVFTQHEYSKCRYCL